MRQLLYVSESLVGSDVRELDRIMVAARANNAMDGLTGLLWTDGKRFAQVLEGDSSAVASLLAKLCLDRRHRDLEVVHDTTIAQRQFGDWSMGRPTNDRIFMTYEERMRTQLGKLRSELGAIFESVIAGSRPPAFS